ncbi:MAG: hypothetical protein Q8L02_05095 [Candidatus Nitrotoga sp.]|nr:hypothetical protein [Candidatus Nitrotoga sp.]
MKKTIVFLTISSCFILGTSMVHADSNSSQGKMNDKMFTMDEKMFKAMDKDTDGKVARHEFIDYTKQKYDEMDFLRLDVDGDHYITPREVQIVNKMYEVQGTKTGTWDVGKDETRQFVDTRIQKDDTQSQKDDTQSQKSGGTSQSGQH